MTIPLQPQSAIQAITAATSFARRSSFTIERTSPWPPRTASCRASTSSRAPASTSRLRWAPTWSDVVPDGAIAQALYFRGGNTSDELVIVVLMRDGVPMRYFPIGAKSEVHVPLRVVEDLEGGTAVELYLAAPQGLTGHVVVDLGLVEV